MLCVAVTQGEGRVDAGPAIPVTHSVTWGPNQSCPQPGPVGAPEKGQARQALYSMVGGGGKGEKDITSEIT